MGPAHGRHSVDLLGPAVTKYDFDQFGPRALAHAAVDPSQQN